MARWEPDAPQRLAVAALELFAEHGYEKTTVVQIAERAGLTKSTFFRHFSDKREVLFGESTMDRLLARAISDAPANADALEAVAYGLKVLGDEVFVPEYRTLTARRQAVIAANPELQEREALKGLGLIAVMTESLRERGVEPTTASVAGVLGALALNMAYSRWGACDDETFEGSVLQALSEIRAASAAASGSTGGSEAIGLS